MTTHLEGKGAIASHNHALDPGKRGSTMVLILTFLDELMIHETLACSIGSRSPWPGTGTVCVCLLLGVFRRYIHSPHLVYQLAWEAPADVTCRSSYFIVFLLFSFLSPLLDLGLSQLNAVIPPADRDPARTALNHTMVFLNGLKGYIRGIGKNTDGRVARDWGGGAQHIVFWLLYARTSKYFLGVSCGGSAAGIGFSIRVKEHLGSCNTQGCEGAGMKWASIRVGCRGGVKNFVMAAYLPSRRDPSDWV